MQEIIRKMKLQKTVLHLGRKKYNVLNMIFYGLNI